MPAQTHGYSGKPLFQKIGVKPGMRVGAVGAPDHYDELMAGAEATFDRASKPGDLVPPPDVLHLFCPDRATLDAHGPGVVKAVAAGGMVWISWPKKASKLFKDLTEDGVREVMLPTGWVDVKVCAVDADWSGLKFLKRKS